MERLSSTVLGADVLSGLRILARKNNISIDEYMIEIVTNHVNSRFSRPELSVILAEVSVITNTNPFALRRKTRAPENVLARACYYAIARKHGYSYSQMSRYCNQNHTTAIYSVRNVKEVKYYSDFFKKHFPNE